MTRGPTVCSWCTRHRHHACPGHVVTADGEFPCACHCQDVPDDLDTPEDDEPARPVEERP